MRHVIGMRLPDGEAIRPARRLSRAGLMLRLLVVAASVVGLAAAAGPGRAGTSPSLPAERGNAALASSRAAVVVAGVAHTCALTRSRGVRCWGYNGHDELGTGQSTDFRPTPVDVSGLSGGVAAISAGARHSCALTSAGGVKCWGVNYGGALGDGTTDRHGTPVDVVGLGSGVAAIAVGYDASCALTSGGGVKCWGSNFAGQVGDGTKDDRLKPVDVLGLSSGVSAIASGFKTCALMRAGTVKCWSGYTALKAVDVPGLNGVIAITAGGPLCALTSSGGVKCWDGDYGPTPVDIAGLTSGVKAIASSDGHACALTSVGGVKCWGLNDHGQLGDGTKNDRSMPVDVSGLGGGVTAIGVGGFHSCAVTLSGAIKCWVGAAPGSSVTERLAPA